jgi:hypothetical protein
VSDIVRLYFVNEKVGTETTSREIKKVFATRVKNQFKQKIELEARTYMIKIL